MKKVIYFVILTMSLTLVFSQGKPCCKNKSGKGKLSCKFNQAKIDTKGDGAVVADGFLITSNAVVQCPNKPGCKCSNGVVTNSSNQKKCASCANAKWWKFWAKKKNYCSTKS